jgi:hypothetical protein
MLEKFYSGNLSPNATVIETPHLALFLGMTVVTLKIRKIRLIKLWKHA